MRGKRFGVFACFQCVQREHRSEAEQLKSNQRSSVQLFSVLLSYLLNQSLARQ